MSTRTADQPDTRALLLGAFSTLALTSVHHAYGAFRYHTPWRHHVALVALGVGGGLLYAASVYRRFAGTRRGQLAGYALAGLTFAFPVLLIGLFEGLYNHGLKNALFFGGAPRPLLRTLFPPPTYELPDDALFELTGVLQAVTGAFTAYALVCFLRIGRRSRRAGGSGFRPTS